MTPDRDSCRGVMFPGEYPLQTKELPFNGERVGTCRVVGGSGAHRHAACDLAQDFDCAYGDYRWDGCSICRYDFYWPWWAWGKDRVDCFLSGNRFRCPHLPCWRRTRSRGLSRQMERSDGGGARGLFRSFFWLRRHCPLRAPLGGTPQLAGRSRSEYDLGRRGLRRHAGARVQQDRFRQSDPWGLLCE